MKNFKKGVLLFICVVALMVSSIFGTMAFLMDTDAVVNTFTYGSVGITLDEAAVDENGQLLKGEDDQPLPRVTENTYHIKPGGTYTKDPMVTVTAGSDLTYVRMILTVRNADQIQAIVDNEIHELEDFFDLLGGWDENIWLYEGSVADETANTVSYEFRYHEPVDGFDENGEPAELQLMPLFTSLVIPGTLTTEELKSLYGAEEDLTGDFVLEITAHAMQALGFEEDEDAAWEAFDEEMQDVLPPAQPDTPEEP